MTPSSPLSQFPQLRREATDVRRRLLNLVSPPTGQQGRTHGVELHVLNTVRRDGRDYRECSCGYVVRFFLGDEPRTCDVEQAEALEAYAFQKAADAALDVVAVINRGREAKAELFGLLGLSRG